MYRYMCLFLHLVLQLFFPLFFTYFFHIFLSHIVSVYHSSVVFSFINSILRFEEASLGVCMHVCMLKSIKYDCVFILFSLQINTEKTGEFYWGIKKCIVEVRIMIMLNDDMRNWRWIFLLTILLLNIQLLFFFFFLEKEELIW